ncbi:MAG: zinc ABC transporter substrate-binding protein [Chloroflexota bacterium]
MRHFLLLLILLLTLTSCGGEPASPSGTSAPVILTSTTFLTDITRNIAGDRLVVESLLPIGADPHSYQPTPQDVTKISQSKLLIINGADYEQFLKPLLENAGGEREVIEASAGINLRKDAQGVADPHVWLNPNNVIVYVENIREALTHFDPQGAAVYQANADAYVLELKKLDAWIIEQANQIPPERKLLITNHEAFGYFAERYGFSIAGTVIESFSSDASPSAQQMAALIDQIKSSSAPAIFLDASDNTTLAQQIAAETNVRVITDLHLESLTDGAPAGTYIDMLKYNVTQIVNALK